jgi:DNA-binding NtrC family response regulator
MKRQVLIVDDEPGWVELLARELRKQGHSVVQAADGAQGLQAISEGFDGVVLLDLRLPDTDGLELVPQAKRLNPDLRIIMMTAHGTHADELEAQRRGVHLFVSKSEGMSRIVSAVHHAFTDRQRDSETRNLRELVNERFRFGRILTRSAKMKRVFETLAQVVDSRVTVLLQGESGTGKELVARAIHNESNRRGEPFIAVNCAGIPDTLLESELFGHEKGAFTGAIAVKKGKFELADGGTLFLDEIGEMPMHLQSKLLRVLQERQVERIGATGPRDIDVRIISATHRDLLEMVREKRFREDLYYRLAVFPVLLPPLRERDGDVALLARHFLTRYCNEENKPGMTLSASALAALERYDFPGNVRELENIMSRAVLIGSGDQIKLQDLPAEVAAAVTPSRVAARPEPAPEAAAAPPAESSRAAMAAFVLDSYFPTLSSLPTLAMVEEALVDRALQLSNGHAAQAARALGMSRATFYRRLKGRGDDDG